MVSMPKQSDPHSSCNAVATSTITVTEKGWLFIFQKYLQSSSYQNGNTVMRVENRVRKVNDRVKRYSSYPNVL